MIVTQEIQLRFLIGVNYGDSFKKILLLVKRVRRFFRTGRTYPTNLVFSFSVFDTCVLQVCIETARLLRASIFKTHCKKILMEATSEGGSYIATRSWIRVETSHPSKLIWNCWLLFSNHLTSWLSIKKYHNILKKCYNIFQTRSWTIFL